MTTKNRQGNLGENRGAAIGHNPDEEAEEDNGNEEEGQDSTHNCQGRRSVLFLRLIEVRYRVANGFHPG